MRVMYLLLLLICVTINTNCKKDKDGLHDKQLCGVTNPLSNLPWLKDKIDSLKAERLTGFVQAYNYHGQEIVSIQVMIQSCFPCNLYTCNGRLLTNERDSTIIQEVTENLDELEIVAEF